MNRFSPQGGCKPRFRRFPAVLSWLVIPALFVLAACSPGAGGTDPDNTLPFFSFSTGSEENDTHPDVHFLTGYFELNEEVANAVAYAVALASTETAPADFAALKAKAAAITHFPASYPVETGKPQWFPLLDLAKQTEYKIYAGVEYEGGAQDNLANPIIQSTVDYNNAHWGILGLREITAYPGQSLIFPGILRIDHSLFKPSWSQRTPSVTVTSDGYATPGSMLGSTDTEVLGQTGFSQTDVFQYHLKIPSIIKQSANATYRVAQAGFIPGFVEGKVIFYD